MVLIKEEFEQKIHTYSDMIFRIAFNYFANREDAEDVMQDTFLKLYQSERRFEDDEKLKAWLIRVTINKCKSMFRSPFRKRRTELPEYEWENMIGEGDIENDIVIKHTVYSAVMELPVKYRVVVYLYYYEDYSIKETAEIIGVKETTVQTQLMRARKKLKDYLPAK